MTMWRAILLATTAAAGILAACSSSSNDAPVPTTPAADAGVAETSPSPQDAGPTGPAPFPATPPDTLSATGLLASPPIVNGKIQLAADLEPYQLATPLFSDYAVKTRAVRFPAGTAAAYDAREVVDFPVGTVITKTFAMQNDRRSDAAGIRVIETRLLVRDAAGWQAYPYFWNDAQTEATYVPGGRIVPIDTIDASGTPVHFSYLVPSKNQCTECHHLQDAQGTSTMTPIGPKARNLNIAVGGENQLERWARNGHLTGLPAVAERPRSIDAFDRASGTVEERARTYLDVNCAHCHRPESTIGITTQLFLDIWNTTAFNYGVCKRPGSAGPNVGGTVDVAPGDHTTSVLWYRVQTTESGKMMPVIGRTIEHVEGANLLASWIDGMPAKVCQ